MTPAFVARKDGPPPGWDVAWRVQVPSGPEGWVLKKALKLLLGDVGYNVDGTCARVAIAPLPFLLRWFKADCQCILHAY